MLKKAWREARGLGAWGKALPQTTRREVPETKPYWRKGNFLFKMLWNNKRETQPLSISFKVQTANNTPQQPKTPSSSSFLLLMPATRYVSFFLPLSLFYLFFVFLPSLLARPRAAACLFFLNFLSSSPSLSPLLLSPSSSLPLFPLYWTWHSSRFSFFPLFFFNFFFSLLPFSPTLLYSSFLLPSLLLFLKRQYDSSSCFLYNSNIFYCFIAYCNYR